MSPTLDPQAAGRSVDVSRDMIDVTSNVPYPDPDWRSTDASGHEHYRKDDGYPTLRWIVDESAYSRVEHGFLEEYPEAGHYECSICGERITPGTKVDAVRRYVPGPTRATATDPIGRQYPLSEADMDTIRAQGLAALPHLIASRSEQPRR